MELSTQVKTSYVTTLKKESKVHSEFQDQMKDRLTQLNALLLQFQHSRN